MAEKKPANRDNAGRFVKGQSGNPSGKRPMDPETKEALLKLGPKAVARLAKLLDSDDETVAERAVDIVFNRLWGKPVQPSDVNMDVSGGLDLTAQIHAALLRREEERRNGAG